MYAKGSPKYNMMQLGRKKASPTSIKNPSPKIAKRGSPRVDKPKAQWNPALEKSLVDLLHDHNNPYFRGQNGWTSETWNRIVSLFHDAHKHVNFTKSQIQDKEKELKRDYRLLKDARKQSEVGWSESKCMLEAEAHLWNNLTTSLGARIKKFKNKSFHLYNSLGELYDGHTADGQFNFVSIDEPSQIADATESVGEFEAQRDEEKDVSKKKNEDDDLQILDQVDAVQGRAVMGPQQSNQGMSAAGSRSKRNKGLVGVMQRFVDIKEKQAKKKTSQDFSITRCIAVLKTVEGVAPHEKIKAYDVFKNPESREIFVNAAMDQDGSALMWFTIRWKNDHEVYGCFSDSALLLHQNVYVLSFPARRENRSLVGLH